jgi:hypothetical protein
MEPPFWVARTVWKTASRLPFGDDLSQNCGPALRRVDPTSTLRLFANEQFGQIGEPDIQALPDVLQHEPRATGFVDDADLTRKSTDHLRMDAAVIAADRAQRHRRTERPRIDVTGVNRAIVEHHTVRHCVDVMPYDCPTVRNAGGFGEKDCAPLIATTLMTIASDGAVG